MPTRDAHARAAARTAGRSLPVIAAAVVLLLAGGFVAYRKLGAPPKADAAAALAPDPGVVELEPLVVNLADASGDRYIRLTLRLLVDQKSAAARAAAGLPQVKLRDRILNVLSKKRASELAGVEGKEALRAELVSAAEALFAEPNFFAGVPASGDEKSEAAPAHVVDAFFTEFLVQ